jgi:hypothetical protein
MFRLKTLRVKNFRGVINGPDLSFEEGGLFLCGDNGTGKSSYIDAIEKVLTGKCGTLEGVQGISWAKHAKHITCKSEPEIELIITDEKRDYSLSLNTDISTLPTNLQNYINSAKKSPFFLRRKVLLNFVNSLPNERYKTIEGFLKLDRYNQFEIDLKDIDEEIRKKIEYFTNEVKKIQHSIETTLEVTFHESINDNILITILNDKIQGLDLQKIVTLNEIDNLISQIDSELKQSHDNKDLQSINFISSIIDEFPGLNSLIEIINDYLINYNQLSLKERELKGHFYSSILENGLKWIQEDSLIRCPLCDNEINPKEVVLFVNQRLSENKAFLELQNEVNASKLNLTTQFPLFLEPIDSIQNKWVELWGHPPSKSLVKIHLILQKIGENIKTFSSSEELKEYAQTLSEINIDDSFEECKNFIEIKKRDFDGYKRYQKLFELKSLIIFVQTQYPQYLSIFSEYSRLLKVKDQISIAINLAKQGRKIAVQKFIDSIGNLANSFFQVIHPDEFIGKPQLKISDRGMGSIELQSSFYNNLCDPRGYYSEGHLDSLGLCLFLAIRRLHKQKNPEFSLLILDDVLHSIDGQHRLATAQLILNEYKDHQIIISTHDRLWFEHLTRIGTHKKIKKYRISAWSLEGGPCFGDHKSDSGWLSSPDREKAIPEDKIIRAARLLEDILQNLCFLINVSVPYNPIGLYTLDPLWSGFYSKARKKSNLYVQNSKVFEDIEQLRRERNWAGAHYNSWARGISDFEANQSVQSVLLLYSIIYCCDCNSFIMEIPKLQEDTWRCKCEKLHYEKK